jgi:hypothetical protein
VVLPSSQLESFLALKQMYSTFQQIDKVFLLCPTSIVDTVLLRQLNFPSFLYRFCSTNEDKMFDSRGENSYS